jgi:hypothetical protein
LRKLERRPQYQAAPDRPITFPVFEASPEQRKNMQALLQLHGDRAVLAQAR